MTKNYRNKSRPSAGLKLKKTLRIFSIALCWFSCSVWAALFAQEPPAALPPKSVEEQAPLDQATVAAQTESNDQKDDHSFSLYKPNYFAFNKWFSDEDAQIKFQFSFKYRVLKNDLWLFKHKYIPLYFAYTQKSFWNIGQPSAPFEESNYNPEMFLDYPLDFRIYKGIYLRNLMVSPFEHESNGQDGAKSRSWNRQYIAFSFGLEPEKKPEKLKPFIQDKMALQMKFWHAYGYNDQDDYLHALGRNDDFLDYMGRGELMLSIRNILGNGSWGNNQLDLKTRLFQDSDKDSYEFVFQQHIPNFPFSVFLQ
ncbi:MAG: hypothetical protein EHM45_23200, partial [Desulfobacteraceae bacterium]